MALVIPYLIDVCLSPTPQLPLNVPNSTPQAVMFCREKWRKLLGSWGDSSLCNSASVSPAAPEPPNPLRVSFPAASPAMSISLGFQTVALTPPHLLFTYVSEPDLPQGGRRLAWGNAPSCGISCASLVQTHRQGPEWGRAAQRPRD